jgi:hypothetical protein
MAQNFENSKEYLRKLTTIAYLNMSVPLLLFGWLYLETSTNRLEPRVESKWTLWIFVVSSLLMILFLYLGNRSYHYRLSEARKQKRLVDKLLFLKEGVRIRFTYFGFAGLIVTAGIFSTASELFAIPFSMVVVLFSINNPTLYRIVKVLQVKDEEKDTILKSLPL